jgi:hypothetical protein
MPCLPARGQLHALTLGQTEADQIEHREPHDGGVGAVRRDPLEQLDGLRLVTAICRDAGEEQLRHACLGRQPVARFHRLETLLGGRQPFGVGELYCGIGWRGQQLPVGLECRRPPAPPNPAG